MEKNELYRQELDYHYDNDLTSLKGEVNALLRQQEVDRSIIRQLERENNALKMENDDLHHRRRFVEKENRPVQPRMISTKMPANPYVRKPAGPVQTSAKKPDSSYSSQVRNPYIPRTYYR